ncbi:AAA-like domain-containing protein [Desulfobacterales bacterium HSG2]|nr:AAA-like domain-containing protein [Desulfobacterales bacterium HSG2]
MKKFFNIAGPCHPDKHYMLPAQERCKGIKDLIDQEQYFVIHAARQSGKTTLLLDLARQLNSSGEYYALYCSLESVQGISDVERGIPAVVRNLIKEVEFHNYLEGYSFAENADYSDFNNVLVKSLSYFCKKLDKPLVILFDEADCLTDETLISFLRQLRDGYVNRNRIPFAHSVGLIGMRNIRDYKAKVRADRNSLGSASPFNIVSEVFTLRDFGREEIGELYGQHADQTGQGLSSEVIEEAWYYTRGQPWLVNAVAREIIVKLLGSDFSAPILPEHAEQAVQNIIFRRDTHIDSLLERLKEDRVRKIVEPVIIGESRGYDLLDDDYQYVLDLGLLRESDKKLVPANPVYGEIIIRGLSFRAQMEMEHRGYPPLAPAYLSADGRLDMKRLLTDFQHFWRENSAIWIGRYQYKEAAPHLVLMAFLQRVINTGGKISREFASGRGRLDLCVHYAGMRYPIELKLRYGPKTYEEGKKQLGEYMDTLGCDEGWLIVFDRRKSVSWKKKIFWKTVRINNRRVHIVGC